MKQQCHISMIYLSWALYGADSLLRPSIPTGLSGQSGS